MHGRPHLKGIQLPCKGLESLLGVDLVQETKTGKKTQKKKHESM